jgi:hypothetical protein
MATEEQGPSTGSRRPTSTRGTPWFGPDRSGVGYRQQTRQGRVILGACVATPIVIVVLLPIGLL